MAIAGGGELTKAEEPGRIPGQNVGGRQRADLTNDRDILAKSTGSPMTPWQLTTPYSELVCYLLRR
ncbi:hypothetical protein Mycsm_01772 [Mycobacterium sp. JS623]|nr:hypothetical protein Mycsm_01772 [Mycobacterium sp. JS623]